MTRVLLISTYDMGRQPFALASAAAWLRAQTDAHVDCLDLDVSPPERHLMEQADLIAFYLPMHTATRLALPLIEEVRDCNPAARLCGFGLYAPLNEQSLRRRGVELVLGSHYEQELVEAVMGMNGSGIAESSEAGNSKDRGRKKFMIPDRSGLPPLSAYAQLVDEPGGSKLVGYTETTQGCKHLCRHCPVVPVYQGRFVPVPHDVVLADVAQQVANGARHITFGDPDFFNGPSHGLRIVEALHEAHPGITYDVTIKIEHLLKQRRHLGRLKASGCLFVTTAVESLDDEVLGLLDKGHTRRDFEEALDLCREIELTLCPTFVPFTPWTSREDYLELLDGVASLGLVESIPPIQLAIRLLITAGSLLLQLESVQQVIEPFDDDKLVYPWRSPHAGMDELADAAMRIVNEGVTSQLSRLEIFQQLHDAAGSSALSGGTPSQYPLGGPPKFIPHLTENWFC